MNLRSTFPNSSNRSSLVFLIGLSVAAVIATSYDGWGRVMLGQSRGSIDLTQQTVLAPAGPTGLQAEDLAAARVAWRYFALNTRPETGFVDAVAGFPSATLWDQGSYLLALNAALALEIVDGAEFHGRVDRFLGSLEGMELFNGQIPNKAYNTQTLRMVDYDNSVTERGVGWSALDMGRLLAGMRVLERRNPQYGDRIRGILSRWELDAMAYQGELTGAALEEGELSFPQEGRIGYEQYAARAAALWGLDVIRAISVERNVDWDDAFGISVPIDRRTHSAFGSINPTLSEPYVLQGLELGFDSETQHLAAQVYLAQEARFERTGTRTMVSEDHINQPPYFLYSSVHSNGEQWAVVTEKGEFHNDKRTVSLKAVFGWDALYRRKYTQNLRAELSALATEGGWPAGVYEGDGAVNDVLTLNTNAVVLEAVHYMAFGPLWQLR